MKSGMPSRDLPHWVQAFFVEYLQNQRQLSPATIASYRDTLRLLLQFVQQHTRRSPSQQRLTDWDALMVLRFLDHLEKDRGNTVRTRNARLAAICSFMRYVAQWEPSTLALSARVLAIPHKRFERPLVGFLAVHELKAVLQAIIGTSFIAQRDRLLFYLLHQTGARISELLALNRADIEQDTPPLLRLRGKGRKQRSIPLSKATARQLQIWLKRLPAESQTPVFPARLGHRLTRFGAAQRLRCAVRQATQHCPSLAGRSISLHMLRHTTAMHLLQAGVDLTVIALWLGHERPTTTHHYLELDLKLKEQCLKRLPLIPEGGSKRFKPNDQLLEFLERL